VSDLPAYVQPTAFKLTLDLSGTTFGDADIVDALTSASEAIDEVTSRKFRLDEAPTTRYYMPLNCDECMVDDVTEVVSVKSDFDGDGTFEQTWTEGVDFDWLPENAELDGKPFTWVVRRPRGRYRLQPSYRRSLEVTGRFGWPVVPAAVKQATTILASALIKRAREAPFGVVSFGLEGQAVRIAKTDPQLMMLLNPLVKTVVGMTP